jgi:hypothetical protein
VGRARALVRTDFAAGAGTSAGPVSAVDERWEPPAVMAPLLGPAPPGGWPLYAHDLAAGQHGFDVDAGAGQAVLARTRRTDDTRYVVDLGALRGVRVVPGDAESPPSAVQTALF